MTPAKRYALASLLEPWDAEPSVLTSDGSAKAALVRARLEQRLRELDQAIARIPLTELERPGSVTAGRAAPTAVFEDLAQRIVELRRDVSGGFQPFGFRCASWLTGERYPLGCGATLSV